MPASPLLINLNVGLNANSDPIAQFAKGVPTLFDAFLDENAALHRRPGLLEFTNISDTRPIKGAYWWEDRSLLIVTDSLGQVYKIDSDRTVTNITSDPLTALNPPTFADNGSVLIIADGGRMIFTDGTTDTAYIGDVDAPTQVTHVAFYNQYIIANSLLTGTFYYSEVNDYTDWRAISFFTAETSPDPTISLIMNWQELILLGRRTIETWINDGVSPFRRITSTFIDHGCGAPYSVTKLGNTLAYIDDQWSVVRIQNRVPITISKPIDRFIKSFPKVSDAEGTALDIAGRNFYVLTFPSANVTLAYDWILDKWYRWGFWNTSTNEHDRWLGGQIVFATSWGKTLIASNRSNGLIYEISPDYTDDNGDVIRYLERSGSSNYGSPNDKVGDHLKLRVKRGIGDVNSPDPFLMLRSRDNNGVWSSETQESLGDPSDSNPHIEIPASGTFDSREWELSYTDEGRFVLVSAHEHAEVLSS